MTVNPVFASVGRIFGREPIYKVPKYQRSYAWDKLEIEDFVKDIEICFQKRKVNRNQQGNHFFGGIVSVEQKIAGAVDNSEFELVDGQQRMATFVILISAVIARYKELLIQARAAHDATNEKLIERRIDELATRFIEFEQELNRNTQTVEVLRLSRADEQFFRDLIRQRVVTPGRSSHERLLHAYNELLAKVTELENGPNLNDKLDNLEIFKIIMDSDFSLIHMKTGDKKEAYILFRVLNDRGKSLTDGDLLRARTLEVLEGHGSQQTSVEHIWDNILADPPNVTEEYLRWIYASNQGSRAGANTLYDDFLSQFYPQHNNPTISTANADAILRKTQELKTEIENCRKLTNGEWPFPVARPVTQWDRNRLSLLITELRLTVTMPILLAACKLDQAKFSATVQILERFMFRFKIIGNKHVTPAINIFHTESLAIRSNPAGYVVNSVRGRLHTLQQAQVNDTLFKTLLDGLSYKDGGGNQPIKYFLMSVEYYLRWYKAGASGDPVCQDKTRIYDFSSTTIEHIYPKSAQGAVVDAGLEQVKNSLGNLTFMGPTDNELGGNDDFATKKPIFQASSVMMNQDIATKAGWNAPEVANRMTELKTIGCAIFNI